MCKKLRKGKNCGEIISFIPISNISLIEVRMKKGATQKIANPKIKFLLAVLIALLVVGGILCIIFFKQQAVFNAHSNGMIQGENTTEKNPDSIAIPGYEGLTLKADTLQQTISLNNPEQNTCLFIIELYLEDETIVDGLIVNLEDIILFVDQIDKDKLSDMTTNIIRKELIKYTQDQCKLWGIPLETETTLPYWVPEEKSWMYSEEQLLIIENREILLVPKFIVSPINIYNASKYNWHYVVEQERNFHLSRRSELVRVKRLKGGRLKYYLPKKDVNDHINNQIKRGDYLNRKDYIKEYTKKHPELLQTFISDSRKISKSLKNENIASTLKIVDDIDEIIELLKINLARIPVGKDSASTYHKYIKSLLEILWYPYLTNPIIEREIHEGRKRIDIVMDNNATEGFFHKIHDVSKVFCPYIFIECKNYGREVSNPELDQLSGRFATMRGQLGLLLCRAVTDRKLLLKRCKDTFSDGRGLIIPLTDDDIIQMLDYTKEDNIMKIWDYLDNITREIML